MNHIFRKFSQLRRVLMISLVTVGLSSLMMVGSAQAADADYIPNERGQVQSTERYDAIQSKVGGMNQYNDTDPRRNTAQAEAKAQKLSDVAERRNRAADGPLEPVRDAIQDLKEDLLDD